MKRDTVINVLLIIAGIVLAIALFGAGVLWRSRVVPKKTGLVQTISATRPGQIIKRRSHSRAPLPNAGLVDPKLISQLRENA